MNFEFATATRIIFGSGKLSEVGPLAAGLGQRIFVVTGATPARAQPLLNRLTEHQLEMTTFAVAEEPTVAHVETGVAALKAADCELVISFGGGSVIDAGKAIAALATNPGSPLDYLEVIGRGQSLGQPPLPFIALPTTAGTGAEVTKNAVLASPEHRVKVSLRSPMMLPYAAIVDPALTVDLPPAITASTGMDALTQVLEPFVTHLANPLTDALCRAGLTCGARSLRRGYQHGDDLAAREDVALMSLFGGLALANAKLGAVHGFAGVLGGMYHAPHGAICAALLPPVMAANVQAMQTREPENPALSRYQEIAQILTQRQEAAIDDGIRQVQALSQTLQIPGLAQHGILPADFETIIEKSAGSSSMKGNPISLTKAELREILEQVL